jgi:DMSO reductase anchor subunit
MQRSCGRLTVALLFVAPFACSALLIVSGPAVSMAPAAIAVVSAVLCVVIERWLFFAEAEHVAMLYYGADAA